MSSPVAGRLPPHPQVLQTQPLSAKRAWPRALGRGLWAPGLGPGEDGWASEESSVYQPRFPGTRPPTGDKRLILSGCSGTHSLSPRTPARPCPCGRAVSNQLRGCRVPRSSVSMEPWGPLQEQQPRDHGDLRKGCPRSRCVLLTDRREGRASPRCCLRPSTLRPPCTVLLHLRGTDPPSRRAPYPSGRL